MKKYDELQGVLYTLSFHELQNCTETQTTIQNKLKELKKKIDTKTQCLSFKKNKKTEIGLFILPHRKT